MKNLTKRNILWIVPILIIIIFWYYYGPKKEITDNEYIRFIQQSAYSSQTQTFEEAFSNYCKSGKWVYFQTSKNQNVVEFKGSCPKDHSIVKVNLQFIVDKDMKNFAIGALLIDDELQSKENKEMFLQSLYEKEN